MPRIGLITNANSTGNKAGSYAWSQMEALLTERGVGPVLGRDTHSVAEIRDVVREFREQGVTIVCVNGGDGTQHHVANEIVREYGAEGPYPLFVPLKGGAMNMLAKNLGVTDTPAASLARVADLVRAWRDRGTEPATMAVHTMQVDCPALGFRGIAFVYATGLAYKVLVEYYKGAKPGFVSAFRVVMATIVGYVLGRASARAALAREPIRLEVDGQELPFSTVFIACAATIPRLVLWFRPFKREHVDGQAFYLMANDMDPWDVIKRFGTISVGACAHDRLFNEVVRSATIEARDGFTLDGELFSLPHPAALTLSPGPTFRCPVL